MAWSTLTTDEVLEEFNSRELAAIDAIKGRSDLAGIVTRVVQQFRGAILAGNYPVGDEGTLPDGLKAYAIAMARWKFLISVAKNESLQTKDRKDANDKAETIIGKIANMDYAVEDPIRDSQRAGNWNSENKLISRTHPTPPASKQAGTSNSPPYSNPDAPSDN